MKTSHDRVGRARRDVGQPRRAAGPRARRALALLAVLGAGVGCAARGRHEFDWGRGGAAPEGRAQVLAAVDTLLEGMRRKDAARMRQQLDTLARMTLVRPAPDGGVRVLALSGEEFVRVATAPGQPAIDEPIRNPVVQIDGDLATVWAEYQVRRDGQVSHCGHDAFHLVRRQGRWRVIAVADTYRRTGCGAAW